MIESYTVGARFTLVDEFTAKLLGMFEEVSKFDAKIASVNEMLSKVGSGFGHSLMDGLAKADKAFSDLAFKAFTTGTEITDEYTKVGEGVSRGLSDGLAKADKGFADFAYQAFWHGTTITEDFDKVGTGIGKAIAEGVKTAEQEIVKLERLIAGARLSLPGNGGGHPRPGRGGSHGGGHGNAYGSHGIGLDAGIFGFMGYETVKGGVESTLEHGMELAHVQAQMRQAGMSQADIDRATNGAWTEAGRYGLDVSKVLEDIKELRFPFGSTEHAIQFIDPLEKMRVVLNSVTAGSGNGAADAVYEMARAGELKGLQNPEDFIKYFDDMTKVISATGGKVTPKDFMQAMKYGRVASLGWDEEFTTKYLPTLMQSLGPSGGGTAAMSLFGTLAQGKVSKRALEQMEQLGLIGDTSKIIYDGKGDPVGFNAGAIKDTDEFVKNPALWAQHTLLPLLTAKYGDLSNDTTRLHVAEGLGGIFGNRMSAQAISEFILRMQSINKDVGLLGDARGIGGANDLLKNDPTAVMNNFRAAWSNLLTALGQSSVQPAIEMTNSLASAINRFGQFAQANPWAAKQIEGVLGGLAVGLGALAAVGLAAFLPTGVATIAITTFAGVLAGLAAVNWDKINNLPFMHLSWENFDKNIDAIGKALQRINDLGNQIGDAIQHFITSIWDKLKSFLPHLPSTPSSPNPAMDGIMQLNAWHPDPSGSPLEDTIYRGTLRAFTDFANGVGIGGSGSGGGSGFIRASYGGGGDGGSWGGSGGGGGSGGTDYSHHSVPNLRYGHKHGGSAGYMPGPDPVFAGKPDASGFDWSRMGVQMFAKAGYLGDHLNQLGMGEFGAAGMLGHAWAESNYKVDAHNPRLENSHGLFQWNDGVGRWSRLLRWANANHRNPNDPLAQLDYAKVESMHMRGPHGQSVWDAMVHAHSLAEANRIWMDYFEAPKVRDYDNRLHLGEMALRGMHAYQKAAHGPTHPSVIPPARPQAPTQVRVPVHIDGKIVAEVVTHHQMGAARFASHPHYHDDSAHYASPDTAFG